MRGDRLRQEREKQNISKVQLAEIVGVSDQQIRRYESGVTEPSAAVLGRLAVALSVSAGYLTGIVDDPETQATEEQLSIEERALIAAFRRGDLRRVLQLIANAKHLE